MTDVWELRLRRAEKLQGDWPFAAEVLRFFTALTACQRGIHEELRRGGTAGVLDLPRLRSFLPGLLNVVEHQGPLELVHAAGRMRDLPDRRIDAVFRTLVKWGPEAESPEGLEGFFARAILQPCLRAIGGDAGGFTQSCARCNRTPLLSVLREDRSAGAVRRALVCPLCSRERDFPRVLCPACREERPDQLPRYTAEEIPWIRIEACDTCMKYLKAVDLTKCPEAEPLVDELASIPLDVLARERGYAKLAPNLAGI
jgi:FdhE protein